MSETYYIFRNGRLRRKHNTLYLESPPNNGDTQKYPLPVENVRDIYLFGELDLNTKLLRFLGQRQITAHCFNYYGYYVGSFFPRKRNVSGDLLIRQVQAFLSSSRRLHLARQFVKGACYHLLHNLRYYQNRRKSLAEIISTIEALTDQIEMTPDIPSLMGLEGRARDAYYQAFTTIMNLPEPFEKRVRRPPNNPINALISFGNTMLYTAVLTELYVTQLDPTISYLHEPSTRRFSLALDLAEVFKPLIVDRLIFRLWNKRMITDKHFEPIGKAQGVYLNEEGRKIWVREFEKQLSETVQHRKLKRSVSYRRLLRLEAYKLVRHLLDIEPYESFKAWW
ncbi:type I-B CRISPR-associated endonuclease Cas1b [Thermogutta sp.]|uniref:type I-B CRISPR-associated endonuclease Cas1b n=1 Tax=Thermogutta sp. TaxID=1962930 RepID=UPI00321F7DA1